MTDFLWQFAYNMQSPFSVIWLITLAVCYGVIEPARKIMRSTDASDYKYGVAEWRLWTAAQVAVIMSILWVVVMSTPNPSFKRDVVYVDKPVVKIVQKPPVVQWRQTRYVYKQPTYQGVFDKCVHSYVAMGSNLPMDQRIRQCHSIATEAAIPPASRVIRQVRTVTIRDNYKEILESCMSDRYTDRPTYAEQTARLPKCQEIAREGTGRK